MQACVILLPRACVLSILIVGCIAPSVAPQKTQVFLNESVRRSRAFTGFGDLWLYLRPEPQIVFMLLTVQVQGRVSIPVG